MNKKLQYFLLFLLLGVTLNGFSTHIVGGSLTYVYNGGSNYTITLKLYRDCGAGTASLPNSATITVKGLNGASFSPSKDIVLPRISTTNVPSSLDPCAVAPNPLPCVQEGIYSTTVNNLPPTFGGYHLYYQVIARNLSLVNVNAACNCIGESFYAFIPGSEPIWNEDFSLPNGTTVDNGITAWTKTLGIPSPVSAQVNNNLFEIIGANNAEATWTSQFINISSYPAGVNASVNLSENGTLDANDTIFVYYSINGGPLTLFTTNGVIRDDFSNAIASVNGLIGNNIRIVIRVHYDGSSPNSEIYRFDNVVISGGFNFNSNPEFNLFPPLFLCVNQPFTFDHSATDIDGDSLYYSFYTPYNGDNGAGPLDPTFLGNIASFTPVIWQPGFSLTNPLGGAPLTLNSSTGLLSGTPTMLGQFVIGVKVKEYRNGVYLSETLRDFQFNVLSCPQPNPPFAGSDITINDGCTGAISASGYIPSTVTWTSVSPGNQGDYNNYLSCISGCLSPSVTSINTPPTYIDYMICGTAAACNAAYICDTVRVYFNPTLSVAISPQNPTLCFGETSTTITAQGSGGTPPYSYLWNNVNPSQTNLVGEGIYTVMMSDASGCPPVFSTVTVTSYAVPISANAGIDLIICNQSPAAVLNGAVTGATGGIWSGGESVFLPNNTSLIGVSYIPSANELNNGFVELYLTTTGNGACPLDVDTVRINYVGFTGAINLTNNNVSCAGFNDGTATVSITGGFPSHSFEWNTVPLQTSNTIFGLSPGQYTVIIEDSIGCETTENVIITEPQPLQLGSFVTPVSCPNGSDGTISVSAIGGTPNYSYLWTSGGQITNSLTNQPTGSYEVTVTDSNDCVQTITDVITEPNPIVINFSKTDVSCFGGNDGSTTAIVTGGEAPYSYSWSPSGGSAVTASGLIAGSYELTITDNNGCITINTVIINEPILLEVNTVVSNVSCNGLSDGSAIAIVNGGTFPYSYQWSPSGGSDSLATLLSAGTYQVTVTDVLGCEKIAFATISEPQPLQVATNQVNVSCFGGSDGIAVITSTGGTTPYQYLWSPSGGTTNTASNLSVGIYAVNVTDAAGCQQQTTVEITEPTILTLTSISTPTSCPMGNDGSLEVIPSGGTSPYTYLWLPNGQSTPLITNQTAGNYDVTVTDTNGCEQTISDIIAEPNPIVINLSKTDVSCFLGSDGSITADVFGGSVPYNYSWLPIGGTGNTASNLSVGTYTVNVTDNNGCLASNSIAITQPTALIVSNLAIPETCNQSNDGIGIVSVIGGTTPYQYAWMPNVGTTSTVMNLSVGVYSVTITDSLGCQISTNIEITEPPVLTISMSQIDVTCFGGSNGIATAIPSGGTPNYTYSWSPSGATSNQALGLSAGNHTVTVTDQKGCQSTQNVTLNEPMPIGAVLNPSSPSCFGGNDGAVSAIASGGTAPYNYLWMPGNYTGSSVSNLLAGTYQVMITDAEGCMFSNSVTVNNPPQMVLDAGAINSTCGVANGLAYVSVASGGVAPFFYSWSPVGGTSDTASGLFAGSYTVVVTDNNGCQAQEVGNVNDVAAPIINFATQENVSCFGGVDGSASISLLGGIGPFTYLWSPSGVTDSSITGLSVGTYSVLVTGSNNCSSSSSVVITQPSTISANVTTTLVSCFGGNDGTANITAYGGTPNYSFDWLTSGATGSSVLNLLAGVDSVKVTDDNGCELIVNYNVTEPPSPLSALLSSNSVSCFGGSDGGVSAIASGGTAPYTYNWMPGNISGASLSNLPIGNYSVTVTDAKGCTFIDNVSITEPTPIVLFTTSANSNCGQANGEANVSATGGSGGYSYLWSPYGGTDSTATGLYSGNYTVIVTDLNGCEMLDTTTINDNPAPIANISGTTNVSCFGGNNGTATVNVVGGFAPYTYQWSPIGGTNATALNLLAGTYSVVVTDSNGCQTLSVTTPLITQPTPIVASVSTNDVSCFGGNDGLAVINAVGGTPSYSYLWFSSGLTSQSITNLTAGLDSIQVTDTNGCSKVVSYEIEEPQILSFVNTDVVNVSCFSGLNGSASITVDGGTPFYTYQWLPIGGNGSTATGLGVGNYTVDVLDLKGCTATTTLTILEPTSALTATATAFPSSCYGGSNGSATVNPSGGTPSYSYNWLPAGGTNQTATGLSIGNYTVTVTDTNGCTTNTSVTISQPSPIQGSLAIVHPSCGLANGAITTQLSGGTAPYSYVWSSGGAITPNLTALSTGNYSVEITDALGCIFNLDTTLNAIPSPIISINNVSDVSCFNGADGSATISASSGTAPYFYNWFPIGGIDSIASGLSAATYYITITDALGCIVTDSVIINQPTPVSLAATSVLPVACNGGSTGEITVSANGGTPNYTYSWIPAQTPTSTISGLNAGVYEATVSDQNNCTASISIVVSEPILLTASIGTSINPTCFGSSDGSASVVTNGGTLPYNYLWSNGEQNSTAIGLSEGNFSVEVTDANGCSSISSISIAQPNQIITLASEDDTICIGSQAVITATANGGSGGYSFGWQPTGLTNTGTISVSPTSLTSYTVMAFDLNGCPGTIDTIDVFILDMLPSDILINAEVSEVCPGQSIQLWAESSSTSTGDLIFSWNNGIGGGLGPHTVSPTQPTTYIVTATNVCGFSATNSVEIGITPPPTLDFISDVNSACSPTIVQFSDNSMTSNPDDQIHYWNWNFGNGATSELQNPSYTYTNPGNYQVSLTVTTGNGCTNSSVVPLSIVVSPVPTAAFTVNSTELYLPNDILITNNYSTGATDYNWSFGDGGSSIEKDPEYLYYLIGVFQIDLIVTNSYGCSDTASQIITTNADVIFPNAFTPNNSGSSGGIYDISSLDNDIFFPYTSGVVEFNFEIFNRWGELVFVTDDIKKGWDGYYKGELAQKGVYIWKAYLKLNNGKEFNKVGDVTLLR